MSVKQHKRRANLGRSAGSDLPRGDQFMTSLGVPVPTLVTRQHVVFGGRFLGTSCRRQPVSSVSFLEKNIPRL